MRQIVGLESPAPTPSSSPGIGIPTERDFSGPWLSQQLILTTFLGLVSLSSFSLLVKRRSWRSYLAPIARTKSDYSALDEDERQLNNGAHTRLGRFLSSIGLEWLAVTLYTSDVATAHLSGPPTSSIDALSLLKFFRFGTRLFAWMSLWSIAILMPVNWRENGWLDGVAPTEDGNHSGKKRGKKNDPKQAAAAVWNAFTFSMRTLKSGHDEKPMPLPPDSPKMPVLTPTSLYDAVHLATTLIFSGLLLYLLTTRTTALLAHHQRILHSMHASVPARTILVRSLPPALQSSEALQKFFGESLELPTKNAWVLPEVGAGVRKLLARRERALRDLEGAWAAWVGNPVKQHLREEWQPAVIEQRIRERTQRVLSGEETLPQRGWLVSSRRDPTQYTHSSEGGVEADREDTPLLSRQTPGYEERPDFENDPAFGPPSLASQRPSRRIHLLSRVKVDLLSDLEVEFVKLDAALGIIRKKMLEGQWKTTPVGFVEFENVREALITSQALYFEQPGYCRTTLAPDNRDVIWRNIGIPEPERRTRQLLVSIAITLLYIFYLPPLFFLGSLLSPGFLSKYIPGFYKLLSASPRLEALVSTSLPSLVLVVFNASLPMLLEATAVWQGVKTKSDVELSVLKKYHIFLVTSVIFVFFITTTAFGVLLDLGSNPMAILDKLSLSLPQARNFSLSYVILQSLTVLPLQLLSLPIMLMAPFYVMTAKTPREHAEAHAPPLFKAGTIYPQALIVATLGLLYSIVKPLVTIFAAVYFAVGYIVYKYKLLFVFYPPPSSSTGQSITIGVLRPRLIFAVLLFQVFQLSMFSVHGNVIAVFLLVPLIGTTVWYARYLHKRFDRVERFEALEGALEADRQAGLLGDDDEGAVVSDRTSGYNGEAESSTTAGLPSSRRLDWPTTIADQDEHSVHDEHGHDDDPSSEWRSAQRLADETGTGTSTPSEVASLAETPKKQAALSKRIWSPVARLKRGRSRRGHLAGDDDDDEDDDGPSATANMSRDQGRVGRQRTASTLSNKRLVYHRPSSRFTNYREASGLSDASGLDSLPGLVDQSPYSRRRRRLRDGASEDSDSAEDEESDDTEEETDEDLEAAAQSQAEDDLVSYEHPLVHGRLRQVWLPSARHPRRYG